MYITPRTVDLNDPSQKDQLAARVPAQRYGFKNTESLWLEDNAVHEHV